MVGQPVALVFLVVGWLGRAGTGAFDPIRLAQATPARPSIPIPTAATVTLGQHALETVALLIGLGLVVAGLRDLLKLAEGVDRRRSGLWRIFLGLVTLALGVASGVVARRP